MKHEEVLDWIDSADAYGLRRPPATVKDALDRGAETKRYYELSVMLTGPKQTVDLLSRFRLSAAGRKSPTRRTTLTGRLCFGLGAAAVLTAFLLLVTFIPNRIGRDTNDITTVHVSSLELTYDIADNFGISDTGLTDGEMTGNSMFFSADALDYCYAVSLF